MLKKLAIHNETMSTTAKGRWERFKGTKTFKVLLSLSRTYVLLVAAAMVLTISGIWAIQAPDFESILAVIAALVGIISDYFIEQEGNLSARRKILERQTIEELLSMTLLEGSGLNKRTKKGLIIDEILRLEKETRKSWSFGKWIILGLSVIMIPIGNAFFPAKSTIRPEYTIAFYENVNGRLELIDKDSISFDVDEEGILNEEVKLPLQIAIGTTEGERLEIDKIVLSYPSKFQVKSNGGRQQIDPTKTRLIYEHNISTLEPTATFTPIETIDTLVIPFKFFRTEALALTSDSIPLYNFIIIDEAMTREFTFMIEIEIYCKNRPKVSGTFVTKIAPNLKIITDLPSGIPFKPTAGEAIPFGSFPPHADVSEHWHTYWGKDSIDVEYFDMVALQSRVQYIYVERILRRVNVDTDKDGRIDYVLYNTNRDSSPDERINGDGKTPMLEYKNPNEEGS